MKLKSDSFLWTDSQLEVCRLRYGKYPHEMTVEEREIAITHARDSLRKKIEEQRALRRIKLKEVLDELQPVDLNIDHDSDEQPDWLVHDILVADSPAVIGGVEKSLKSSIATDLAVCITASEPTKFLNHFDVDAPSCTVAYLNYEGTVFEFRDRIRRIEKARGIRANQDRLHVLQAFPPLNDEKGLDTLDRLLTNLNDSVLVIIDNLYNALHGSDFSRLSEIGGQLSGILNVCRDHEATPLYVHHFKAGNGDGLQSFSGAGVKEHVGQWLLVHKVGRYYHEAGRQRLRLEIGSRVGFSDRYALEITEGRLSDPGGRRWETAVSPFVAKTVPVTNNKDVGDDLTSAIMQAVTESPSITKTALRRKLKRSAGDIGKVVSKLLGDGKIVSSDAVVRGNATTIYRPADVGRDERGTSPAIESHAEIENEKTTVVGIVVDGGRRTPSPSL